MYREQPGRCPGLAYLPLLCPSNGQRTKSGGKFDPTLQVLSNERLERLSFRLLSIFIGFETTLTVRNYTNHMRTVLAFLLTLISSGLLFAQKEHYIESEGNIIHLTVYGEGEPILIINGGPGMHSEGFKPLARIIGQSRMTILYDQRGTGKSKIGSVDTNNITMDLMVADIEIIRNYLAIESWAILGHSFGGMLASYYTSKYPKNVTGLILSSSGGINMELFNVIDINARLSTNQLDSLKYWRDRITDGDTSYHARFQKGKYLAPAYIYDKSHISTVAHRLTQADLKVNQLVFQNMRKIGFDCTEELKGFESPVLIIQGKQDLVDYSIAEVAHKAFQNSTIVLLDSCAHYGWLDQPVQYFKEINDFLANIERKDTISNNKINTIKTDLYLNRFGQTNRNEHEQYTNITDLQPSDTLFRICKDDLYELGVPSGYVNQKGDTIIPIGKYQYCFLDTATTYAIVGDHSGVYAIDQKERRLYEVYWFDNGPDDLRDGLFRIKRNGKIGYANTTGEIVIEPQFDCANAFENGKAKVTFECELKKVGEYTTMKSDNWFYIDQTGKKIGM